MIHACCYNFVGNHTHTVEADIDYYTTITFPNFDTIPAYTRHYTLSIQIVPDRILEDNELFFVTVRPEHMPDGQPDCRVAIIIKDDDGNFWYNNYTNGVYSIATVDVCKS